MILKKKINNNNNITKLCINLDLIKWTTKKENLANSKKIKIIVNMSLMAKKNLVNLVLIKEVTWPKKACKKATYSEAIENKNNNS